MALRWTDWTESAVLSVDGTDALTPYMDWQRVIEPARTEARFASVRQKFQLFGAEASDLGLPKIVLPRRAVPGMTSIITTPPQRETVLTDLTAPPDEDAVIVGVIDAGLALAHDRFRRAGGQGTRILSCWQQGASWDGQRHLPFGREVMQRDLDRMLDASRGDEASFNRMAGTVDFADPDGERWAETHAPHGTAVADLAAGCDPLSDRLSRLRDRASLIMVELAPRPSIGPSGDFLEAYAIWAIRHIVTTADAIWNARFPHHARRGFPIVINLSYGRHAGPKDGSALIQRFLRSLNDSRPPEAPVRFMLPAGNDNLGRGSAVLGHRENGETRSLCWRVLPEDRTASYVEIWSDPPKSSLANPSHPGPISLAPPAGLALGFGADLPKPGQSCDLLDTTTGLPVARVYCCRTFDPKGSTPAAIGYVLCVAPTAGAARPSVRLPSAPAGAWRISLGAGPLAKLHIQSDQSLRPGSDRGQLSYFEDLPETPTDLRYQTHDDRGALRDSYGLDPVTSAVRDHEPLGKTGPIRRQNTLNALAASAGSLTIAGYRASDGWPADYSATGRGFPIGTGRDVAALGLAGMDAACISDDSAWRGGRLAAAGRSGAVAAVAGTSFASAEAARLVTLALLDWIDAGRGGPPPGDADWLKALAARSDAAFVAAAQDAGITRPPAQLLEKKLGSGRLPRQDHGRVPR